MSAAVDRTLKVLSVLLDYPDRELQQAVPAIRSALERDRRLQRRDRDALDALLDEIGTGDVYDLEERYVALFDRSRNLSLDLFEHVHGESRDRGSAMVDLLETYRAAGFEPVGPQLPDHLPILLEFLSQRPPDEAREILADASHILAGLCERLHRRGTVYAAVFDALLGLAGQDALRPAIDAQSAAPAPGDGEDSEDLEALDAAWEEAQVLFAPPTAPAPMPGEVVVSLPDTDSDDVRRARP